MKSPRPCLGPIIFLRGPGTCSLDTSSFYSDAGICLVSLASGSLHSDTFPSFSTKQVISLLDKFLNLSN